MKKKTNDSKAWASFRIRGIATTLKNLSRNNELSPYIRKKLANALEEIEFAVERLNEEREINEIARRL